MSDREYRLKNVLDQVKDDYDYVFIDCPPSLGLLTLNCLCAADSFLVPLQVQVLRARRSESVDDDCAHGKEGAQPQAGDGKACC